MSMRRHRASLFVEQSVFLPGRPKKNKKKIKKTYIKLNWWHLVYLLHVKNGVLSDFKQTWFYAHFFPLTTKVQVIQNIYTVFTI